MFALATKKHQIIHSISLLAYYHQGTSLFYTLIKEKKCHHQDHAFPWSKGLLFVKESMNFKRRRDSKMVYNEL